MSEESCACLHVEHILAENPNGTCSERWACRDCKAPFVKQASVRRPIYPKHPKMTQEKFEEIERKLGWAPSGKWPIEEHLHFWAWKVDDLFAERDAYRKRAEEAEKQRDENPRSVTKDEYERSKARAEAAEARVKELEAQLHDMNATPLSAWASELAAARENVAGTAALLEEERAKTQHWNTKWNQLAGDTDLLRERMKESEESRDRFKQWFVEKTAYNTELQRELDSLRVELREWRNTAQLMQSCREEGSKVWRHLVDAVAPAVAVLSRSPEVCQELRDALKRAEEVILGNAHLSEVPPPTTPKLHAEEQIFEALGFLTAAVPELHTVEVPRLVDIFVRALNGDFSDPS